MLDAFDTMMQGAIKRAGEATEAEALASGKSAAEAAQAAQDQVARLMIEMNRERARLEGEGARTQSAARPRPQGGSNQAVSIYA